MNVATAGIRFLLASLLLLALPAAAAPAVLVLEANATKTHQKGAEGENEKATKLDVTVRNMSNTNTAVVLETYIVASPVGKSGYYISDRKTEPLKMKPLEVVKRDRTIPLYIEKKAGKKTQIVAETKGYIVRLMRGDKQLFYKAEPTFIARKVEKPAEFQELLDAAAP